MSNYEEQVGALRREVTQLEKTLNRLPESQEPQRLVISNRISTANNEISDLERRQANDADMQVDMSPLRDVERRHIDSVIRRYSSIAGVYGDLTIQGQTQRSGKRLTAAASHFIDLHHEVYKSLTHSTDEESQTTFRVDTFGELFDRVVADNPRIALIGDPGSGKSTTLGRLAYEFARRIRQSGKGIVPILLDLAAMPADKTFADALTTATEEALGARTPNRRETILVIDGLNETSHATVGQIVEWLHANSRVRVIIACRKFDYLDRTLPLRRIDILPLDVGQVRAFIGQFLEDPNDRDRLFWGLAGPETNSVWRWFKHNDALPTFDNFWYGSIGNAYSYEIERKRIVDLQDAALGNALLPGVLEVVRNPFLLYVSIIAYLNDENLPTSRTELLRTFTSIMLERGTWSGSGIYDQRYSARSVAAVECAESLLRDLAFEITRDGFSTGIEEGWLDAFLRARLRAEKARDFLEEARRSGILEWTKDKPPTVRFRHQLIQEYFASVKLGEMLDSGAEAQDFWPADTWWEVTPWDEVALFLAGSKRDATSIVVWLTPVNPSLAFRCSQLPGAFVAETALQDLYEPAPRAKQCPRARARWGRILSAASDPRPGVTLGLGEIPDIDWLRVPAGSYTVGGDDALRELGLYVPPTTVIFECDYFIGRYAVTYAQFEAFVLDGYANDKYWTSEGLAWRGDQEHPRLWNDPQYRFGNHPVVGVTWYECIAFTRWLSAKVANPEAPAWEISLPTDAEWEVACRYPDGRKYAWGDVYTPGIANIDETYQGYSIGPYFLRQTTAVGLYEDGKSALGAYDMCGNVWEWSLSTWDEPYLAAHEISLSGTDHRVVKGNSWYNGVRFASAAAHDCLDPDLGVNDTGLRLVRRQLSTSD
jgi:formylglycine-generating enzyme required for sulfatase activity